MTVVSEDTPESRPLVSVVIPTYNRAHTLCAAIDSILAQAYEPIEIIVVDDGSTDDTAHVLRQYEGKIQYIRQTNAGPAAARNTGIRNSRGELIAFLDSDDLWTPHRLEVQVDVLMRAGDSVLCCLCNVRLNMMGGKTTTSFDHAWLSPPDPVGVSAESLRCTRHPVCVLQQAALIRRAVFTTVTGFDEHLRYLEDYDLALRVGLLGPWAFVREPLVVWRQGSDGLSREALSAGLILKEYELGIRNRICSFDQPLALRSDQRVLMEAEVRRKPEELPQPVSAEAVPPGRGGSVAF